MQIRNFIWIVFWFSFITHNIAQSENVFDKANIEYRNENYEQAENLYLSILEEGMHSADLYFNLGNTYYKLNQLGPSIYYYEKGLQLEPRNKDILNNLHYAKQATIDVLQTQENKGVKDFYYSFLQMLSPNTWAVMSIMISFLLASSFLLYYFTKKSTLKRLWFIGGLILLVGLCVNIFFSYQSLKLSNKKYAIIWQEEVEVRDGPTTGNTLIYYLHEGTKIAIMYEEDNWARILLEDGNEGWVKKQVFKRL